MSFVEYFFTQTNGDVTGIDIGGTLAAQTATPFEFYEVITPQKVEQLPDRLEYLVIPANNYGTPNRKRHTSYKFQINTNGAPVRFTPTLDGVSYAPTTFTTQSRQTVEYFFPQSSGDVIGIDVAGTLASLTSTPFEFYEVITPQKVEQLPDRLEYYRIPNSNFGVAARKRIRTIPFVIDTYGQPITFTPIVDGLNGIPSTQTTSGKLTVYHFFDTDVFGTDFGGIVSSPSGNPFEFYELGQPEDVEVLPVPKVYDQLGPMRFDKVAKLFAMRIRLIMNGSTTYLPYAFFDDSSSTIPTNTRPLFTSGITVQPGVDQVIEIPFPKNINSCMFRLVLGPTADSFHRYDVMLKLQTSGMEGESKWLPIR